MSFYIRQRVLGPIYYRQSLEPYRGNVYDAPYRVVGQKSTWLGAIVLVLGAMALDLLFAWVALSPGPGWSDWKIMWVLALGFCALWASAWVLVVGVSALPIPAGMRFLALLAVFVVPFYPPWEMDRRDPPQPVHMTTQAEMDAMSAKTQAEVDAKPKPKDTGWACGPAGCFRHRVRYK